MKKIDSLQHSNTDSAGVQSAEVGLRLLHPLIESAVPLSLKAISDATDFSPPKAHRYLVSFVRAGLVDRLAETGHYQLGPLAVELGFAALRQIDQDRLGREAVTQLAAELGETAGLVIWTDAGPVLAAIEPSVTVGTAFISIRVGSRLQITRSASGLVFLAFMTASERAKILPAAAAAERNSVEEVSTRLDMIRSRGYATVVDQMMKGLSGLAVPVFDASGRVRFTLAAIGLTDPSQEFGKGEIAAAFQRAAAELSRKFGASSPG